MFEASKLARALAISLHSFQMRVNLPDFSEKNNISFCNADCAQRKRRMDGQLSISSEAA
jgi:hypothetical protein